jgi:hypothetical protein
MCLESGRRVFDPPVSGRAHRHTHTHGQEKPFPSRYQRRKIRRRGQIESNFNYLAIKLNVIMVFMRTIWKGLDYACRKKEGFDII